MRKAAASHDVDVKNIAESSEVSRLLALDTTPWYHKPNLRMLYLCLVPAAVGVEMSTGYDGSVLNGLQAVKGWQDHFNHPGSATLGIISASFSIGSLLSIPVMPLINDRYGRKFCVVFGSLIVLIGVILQTLASNLAMLIVSRLILGIGMPIALAGAAQLLTELCYPTERSTITGFFQGSWYMGAVLAAGVTLGTYNWPSSWSWRLPTLFMALPSLLQLTFIWFVPESPRWLVSRDRHDEALEILIKYHAEGDASSSFVAAEFHQIRETLRLEKEASSHPWLEIFASKVNLRRVAVASFVGLFSQWAGNGLVSYYLAKVLTTIGITERKTQNQINVGLNCWNLVIATCTSFATRYMRRRTQFLVSFSAMIVIFSCWTAASAVYAQDSHNHSAAIAVVALIFIFYMAYSLMSPLQYLYISEVFPFIHRSRGVAVMQFTNKLGAAFNQFVNPIGLDRLKWRYYLVYVIILILETITIWMLYPETQGVSLEEVAVVMEGDNANVERLETKAQVMKQVEAEHVETSKTNQ